MYGFVAALHRQHAVALALPTNDRQAAEDLAHDDLVRALLRSSG